MNCLFQGNSPFFYLYFWQPITLKILYALVQCMRYNYYLLVALGIFFWISRNEQPYGVLLIEEGFNLVYERGISSVQIFLLRKVFLKALSVCVSLIFIPVVFKSSYIGEMLVSFCALILSSYAKHINKHIYVHIPEKWRFMNQVYLFSYKNKKIIFPFQ